MNLLSQFLSVYSFLPSLVLSFIIFCLGAFMFLILHYLLFLLFLSDRTLLCRLCFSGTHSLGHAGLELREICLTLSFQYWDYRCVLTIPIFIDYCTFMWLIVSNICSDSCDVFLVSFKSESIRSLYSLSYQFY